MIIFFMGMNPSSGLKTDGRLAWAIRALNETVRHSDVIVSRAGNPGTA
jgi:hypothetical protein